MSKNIWDLNLDIKFRYSAEIPLFRRRDSAVLNIHLFDTKVKKDISNFKKATISIKYPSGIVKEVVATRQGSGIDTYASYSFTDDISTEVGIYDLLLTIEKDDGFISTPKFHVAFFDNISKAEYEFVKMMQDMQLQIDYLETLLGSIVPNTQIAQANGVAPLDENGKIPIVHMPLFLQDHINTNVYLKMVHGFMIDKNRNLVYETKDGGMEYVGHPDNSGQNNKLNLTTTVKDSIVTLFYSGKGNATVQRWLNGNKSLSDMKLNGTLFTGNTFKISQTGIHTIYYMDNYNNEYLYKFTVDISQIKEPTVNVDVDDGSIIVTPDTPLEIIKIGKGRQTIEWFRTNGTTITKDYKVTEAGEYTVYYKDKQGREYLKYITITEDQIITDDKIPPEITFSETPSGYTNKDKTISINIVDSSEIIDRRYHVILRNSPERNPDINSFRNNNNFGTKMTSNNGSFVLKENATIIAYAKDKFGNDVIKRTYVTTIDKEAPTMSAYDKWNSIKQKYEIHFEFRDSGSGVKEIILPDGTKLNQVEALYSVEEVFETSTFGTKKFTSVDNVGNTKVYSYAMKGKPIKTFAVYDTIYIIREDGYLYSAGGATSGLLGDGDNDSTLIWKDRFSKVITTVKFTDVIQTSFGATNLIDTNGDIWELGEANYLSYNNANNQGKLEKIPVKYNGMTAISKMSSNYHSGSGVSAVLKNGQWLGVGGGWGQIGDGTESRYKTWQPLGKSMPVPFNKYVCLGTTAFYFGTNGKMYASGRNDESLEAGFTPTQTYLIYPTPTECNVINPHGTTIDIVGNGNVSYKWWVMNNKVLLSGDYQTKNIITISGTPPSSDYLKGQSSYNSFMLAYKSGLYFTGDQFNGQFGVGDKNQVPIKTLKKMNWNKQIIDAALSSNTCLFIDSDYNLFMNGGNETYLTPTDVNFYLEQLEEVK